ncbi:MAG TPA: NHLP leader peptide family RiPP precursor [Lacipirellulaceae bacterium]|jgi:hypothetical protein|nr:NHLP leader peptide family RiPP precursor [Lacipirellulaceae bacterium]
MDEEAFKADIVRRAVQDPAFRAALLADPKGMIERTLGQPLPDSLAVDVIRESTNQMYLVLPLAVAGAEESAILSQTLEGDVLTDTKLDHVAGGVSSTVIDYRQDGPLNRALGRRSRPDGS